MSHPPQSSDDRERRAGASSSLPYEHQAAAPLPTEWPARSAPWGTPGNHLTGPIPRIRKRPDGTLDHGEES
ncbi:MAG: hypothetical protein Q4G43_11455 [Mobilicoccus sp.]|nr:hypothetical protein [Mobilicoccus sp.]